MGLLTCSYITPISTAVSICPLLGVCLKFPFFSFLRIPATGFRAHSKFKTSHIKVFNHVCEDSVFKEKYMNRYQDLEFRHLSVGHYSNSYMGRQKCFFISVVLQTRRGACHLLPNLSGSKAYPGINHSGQGKKCIYWPDLGFCPPLRPECRLCLFFIPCKLRREESFIKQNWIVTTIKNTWLSHKSQYITPIFK